MIGGHMNFNKITKNAHLTPTLGVNSNPVMAIQNPATIFVVKKVVSQ